MFFPRNDPLYQIIDEGNRPDGFGNRTKFGHPTGVAGDSLKGASSSGLGRIVRRVAPPAGIRIRLHARMGCAKVSARDPRPMGGG